MKNIIAARAANIRFDRIFLPFMFIPFKYVPRVRKRMVGAYFPCFNQLTAANEILFAFRRAYPDNTVVMVNDAGDKRHQALAEKYHCQYFHEEENIGYPGGKPHYDQIIRWVRRFLHYIQLIDDEWFILLEDDVLILKAVDVSTLQSDINGINPANLLPSPSVETIQSRGYHRDARQLIYGAMGGAIFRTSFFKAMAAQIDQVVDDLTIFGERCPPHLTGQNWYYSDVVLSYLTYLYGGTLGQYPEFAELWFRDLGSRLNQNQVATLNQYKHLYNYPVHPHLPSLFSNKYTLVLPTRGSGEAFDIFVEEALPRYATYLNKEEIDQFILIVPENSRSNLEQRIIGVDLPFVIITDEELSLVPCDGWMQQQINKLAVCDRIRTEHYLILDDDLLLTQPLRLTDLFDAKGRLYYSSESWPTSLVPKAGEPHFATNARWWIAAAAISGVPWQALTGSPNLMGVTPQVLITRVVHQMLHALGTDWKQQMIRYQATEFCLYWIFLLKTLRTDYYIPSNKFFTMDNTQNILLQHLSQDQVKSKIITGLSTKTYFFIVIQSWIRYPKAWIMEAIQAVPI